MPKRDPIREWLKQGIADAEIEIQCGEESRDEFKDALAMYNKTGRLPRDIRTEYNRGMKRKGEL